jgi:rubrerythrin
MKPTLLPVILGCAAALLCVPAAKAEASPQTIKNLNTAFQGESNASNRYAKFAARAAADGFPEVAKLFRATSASEAIHRDNHKAAILDLGGKVETFELEAVTPGSTAENLQAAIKGESYERDTMYPEFLAVAEKDDARPAMRTLHFAMDTEKAHATLYETALAQLGKSGPVDYHVCRVCGMTVTELPARKCSVCRQSRDEYKKIS